LAWLDREPHPWNAAASASRPGDNPARRVSEFYNLPVATCICCAL